MKPSLGRMVLGGAVIATGLVLVASILGDVDAGAVIGRWWPLFPVALGTAQVATERRLRIGSAVLVGGGLVLLALTTGLVDGSVWPVLGALLLVALGVLVMAPRSSRRVQVEGTDVAGVVALGARRWVVTTPQLRSGDVTVVAASGVVDLSAAGLAPGAGVKVTVVLGGCDLIVPHGWAIRIGGLPLLGSWDDTTRRDLSRDTGQVLEVNATVVLGGLEVRHAERWG